MLQSNSGPSLWNKELMKCSTIPARNPNKGEQQLSKKEYDQYMLPFVSFCSSPGSLNLNWSSSELNYFSEQPAFGIPTVKECILFSDSD